MLAVAFCTVVFTFIVFVIVVTYIAKDCYNTNQNYKLQCKREELERIFNHEEC